MRKTKREKRPLELNVSRLLLKPVQPKGTKQHKMQGFKWNFLSLCARLLHKNLQSCHATMCIRIRVKSCPQTLHALLRFKMRLKESQIGLNIQACLNVS